MSTKPGKSTSVPTHSDVLRPFVPAWLDELQLTAAEFRVYAHVWRWGRTKTGLQDCTSDLAAIIRTCRLSEPTVLRCLKSLVGKGLITRRRRYQDTSSCTLIWPPTFTQKDWVNDSPKSAGGTTPKSAGCVTPKSAGYNGMRAEREEKDREESAPAPFTCPDRLDQTETHAASRELKLDADGVGQVYRRFVATKAPWLSKDHPTLDRTGLLSVFLAWATSSAAGRQAVAAVRPEPSKDYSKL